MNYHLHRNGQTTGVFSLEELSRRRATGEISGGDLVWCEGMPAWQPLDAVLRVKGFSLPIAPPPAIPVAPKPRLNRTVIYVICGVAIVLVAFAVLLGIGLVKFAKTIRETTQHTASEDATDAADIAARQVQAGSNSLTEAKVRERNHEFRVRQYAEGYRQNGRRDEPCDAEAMQLIDSWIAANFGGPTNLPSPQALGNKLAAQPDCDDPVVLIAAEATCNELHEKIRRLERAVAAFPSSRHKAYPRLYANVELASHLAGQTARIRPLDQQSIQFFKQTLMDGSVRPADEEEIAEILVHGWGRTFFERNRAALYPIAQGAKGFTWLGLVLEGEYHVDEAWKARGSGWADSVSGKGWEGFEDHLAKARAALTSAWKLHPERPFAPASMIQVAMGESGAEDMRTWFDRAVAAQIDYPQAWSSMRWGLRPRWHGSPEAMLALGLNALETKRFDTDVPRKFFDVVSDLEAESELGPGEHLYGREDIWPHMAQMYEGYIAAPTEKKNQNGWRSTYAAVAYLAGKYEAARKQLEALNWKPLPRNLTGWGTDLSLMPLKVAALTGESGGRVARAETSADQLDLGDAVKVYSELNESADSDERTKQFSRSRLAALKQEQLLAKGQWLNFLPTDAKDPNWSLRDNNLRWLDDGSVEVSSANDGHAFYCRTRVGPEFELTGEFEVVRTSNKDFQAGVMMGLPDNFDSLWYGFRLKRNATEGQGISFSRGWSRTQIWKPVALNDDRNTFQFRLQGGKVDAWVNGTQVMKSAVLTKDLRLRTDCLVGLGAYNDTNETVIRYRNLKLRRLLPGL